MSEIYLPKLIDKVSDFVPGLKSNWQDYEAHKAETEADNVHGLQDMIQTLTALFGAEYGKNADGDWIRFNFGLQVCWGTVSFDTAVTSPSGSTMGNTGNRNITLPKSFSEPPASCVFVNGKTSRANVFTMGANTANTTSIIRFRFASFYPESEVMTYYVDFFAIGWWKTPENPTEWSDE